MTCNDNYLAGGYGRDNRIPETAGVFPQQVGLGGHAECRYLCSEEETQ